MRSSLILALMISTKLWAWGDIGHSTVGAIAEQNLTEKGKAFIRSLIGLEPLSISAVYPDHVRSDARYVRFAPFHFLEIPVGATFATMPADWRVDHSAHVILDQGPAFLVNKKMSQEEKAIILRYLIHIVGDVHQPLHVGNGIDRGANLCSVKYKDGENVRTTNLHSFWDDGIIKTMEDDYRKWKGLDPKVTLYFGAKEMTEYLNATYGLAGTEADRVTAEAVAILNPQDWYGESQKLHSQVYYGDEPHDKRSYCKIVDRATGTIVNGAFDAAKVPLLDADYIAKSKPIIKKQLMLSGLRLAGVINAMAEKVRRLYIPRLDADKALEKLMLKDNQAQRTPSSKKAHQHAYGCEH
jgi:hypothetical protein